MRAALLALLVSAAPVFAQNSTDYLPGLLQALTGLGLTRLVGVAQNVSSTPTGQALLADLPNGNKTFFAPNDRAFSGTPPSNITDPNELAAIISYHVVNGSFATFVDAPAHTIVRTSLNATQFVTLEGNKSQVLVLSTSNNTGHVDQQNTPVSVIKSMRYQNLIIHVVDAVIDIPPPLSLAIASHNLSSFTTGVQQANLTAPLEAAKGITIFAPSDAAFAAANQTFGGASANGSLLAAVLGNHVINGTTVYSTQLGTGNYTSASGQPFAFNTNASGTFVTSGPSTARVVQTDVLVSNGVVHVIDNVLLNPQNDSQAASSAYASATSVAAQPTNEASGVGSSGSGSGSNSGSGSGTSSGNGGNGGNGNGNGNGSGNSGGNSGAASTTIPALVAVVLALAGSALVL